MGNVTSCLTEPKTSKAGPARSAVATGAVPDGPVYESRSVAEVMADCKRRGRRERLERNLNLNGQSRPCQTRSVNREERLPPPTTAADPDPPLPHPDAADSANLERTR